MKKKEGVFDQLAATHLSSDHGEAHQQQVDMINRQAATLPELIVELDRLISTSLGFSKSDFLGLLFDQNYTVSTKRRFFMSDSGKDPQFELYLNKDSVLLANPIRNESPLQINDAEFVLPVNSLSIENLQCVSINPGDHVEIPLPAWVTQGPIWPQLSLTLLSGKIIPITIPVSPMSTAECHTRTHR